MAVDTVLGLLVCVCVRAHQCACMHVPCMFMGTSINFSVLSVNGLKWGRLGMVSRGVIWGVRVYVCMYKCAYVCIHVCGYVCIHMRVLVF